MCLKICTCWYLNCTSLTLSPPNKLLSAKFFVCFNFKSTSMLLNICSMFVKLLSECQIAWIWVRRQVTWRLIQIQAVCIYGTIVVLCGLRVKVRFHTAEKCIRQSTQCLRIESLWKLMLQVYPVCKWPLVFSPSIVKDQDQFSNKEVSFLKQVNCIVGIYLMAKIYFSFSSYFLFKIW